MIKPLFTSHSLHPILYIPFFTSHSLHPIQVVQRRVKLLEDEGIKFVTGVEVGKQIKAKQLLSDSDAILITTGSTRPRDLPIPGESSSS